MDPRTCEPVEARAVSLLRACPEVAIPLRALHRELDHPGARVGLHELGDRLARHGGFVVMEPTAPYGPWQDAAVADTLRRLGYDADVRVALLPSVRGEPEATVEGALGLLADTLVDLWRAAERDPVLRAELLEDMGVAAEIRRRLLETDTLNP